MLRKGWGDAFHHQSRPGIFKPVYYKKQPRLLRGAVFTYVLNYQSFLLFKRSNREQSGGGDYHPKFRQTRDFDIVLLHQDPDNAYNQGNPPKKRVFHLESSFQQIKLVKYWFDIFNEFPFYLSVTHFSKDSRTWLPWKVWSEPKISSIKIIDTFAA